MELKNSINNKINSCVIHDGNILTVTVYGSSEYAVMIIMDDNERLIDIIKSGCSEFCIDLSTADELYIADIYTDEKIFSHTFGKIAEPEKTIKEESIISHEVKNKTEGENNMQNTLPPPLLTMKKSVQPMDTKFLNLLESYDKIHPYLKDSDVRIFDEKILKENGTKVKYHGMDVPVWYPYLNYTDLFCTDTTHPKRLIGKAVIKDNEYITYFVLCNIRYSNQPFWGNTGFVYLLPVDEDYAYWMMCLEPTDGNIAYPYDEEIMQSGCED